MKLGRVSFREAPTETVYQKPVHEKETGLVIGYQSVPYKVLPIAGIIEERQKRELESFVNYFVDFTQCRTVDAYLRVDCYIGANGELIILEINSRSADGWGPAFHLSRIVQGNPVLSWCLRIPTLWTTYDLRYAPAIKLACKELNLVGYEAEEIDWQSALANSHDEIFAYLQNAPETNPKHIVPGNAGLFLEDKLMLARFSIEWGKGYTVTTPSSYWAETTSLNQLRGKMGSLVFKPKRSSKAASMIKFGRANQSPHDVVDALDYLSGNVIAQDRVTTREIDGSPLQAILLFAPFWHSDQIHLVGGYLQIASPGTTIINDMAAHGPILIDP